MFGSRREPQQSIISSFFGPLTNAYLRLQCEPRAVRFSALCDLDRRGLLYVAEAEILAVRATDLRRYSQSTSS